MKKILIPKGRLHQLVTRFFMKKKYLSILALLLLSAACDTPQRTRAPVNYVNGNTIQNNGGATPTPYQYTDYKMGTVNTTGNASTGSGFDGCDLTAKHHTIDIGFFGICQSTMDETIFQFRPTLSSPTIRTCLIPTYKDNSGASTYIGNPQCTYTTSNKIVQGRLMKDRQGFSDYPINGVIVMKEPLLPEYVSCMQAYANWPAGACPKGPVTPYCGHWIPRCLQGAKSNPACDAEARNFMATICNTFKTKYSNSYIDIRTK